VSWSVISFVVGFGAEPPPAPKALTMDFATFRGSFLPPDADICKIKISSGLVREIPAASGAKEWVVTPEELSLLTETAIPATRVLLGAEGTAPDIAAGPSSLIGIRAMATGPLVSTHSVSVRKLAGNTDVTERIENLRTEWLFDARGRRQKMPKELWEPTDKAALPAPGAETIPGCLVGVGELRPGLKGLSLDNPPAFDILNAFAFDEILRFDLPIRGSQEPAGEIAVANLPATNLTGDAFEVIESTVFAVRARRSAIIALTGRKGFRSLPDEPLGTLAAGASTALQFAPMLGALGSQGVQRPTTVVEEILEEPRVSAAVIQVLLRLLAEFFQWEPAGADAARGAQATSGTVEIAGPEVQGQPLSDLGADQAPPAAQLLGDGAMPTNRRRER
jgi:hypothetical protein